MLKKCAIIGASAEAIHAIKIAQEEGYYVYALDGNKDAVGLAVADESIVIDIRDASSVAEILKLKKISFLLPVPIGRWLISFGVVNEIMNMTGVYTKPICKCVDKWKFHELLYSHHLRNVKCELINNQKQIEDIDFFPCVMKPRYGSGSRLVFCAYTKDELSSYAEKLDYSEDYLIEEYFEGKEYGVDAAVINGELQIILLREKINTAHPICQCIGYCSVTYENEKIYKLVHAKIKKVVDSLELNNCVMHADLMIQDEEVFVIEMSPRPSGHYCYNVFTPFCTGVDMVREYIRFIENREYSFKTKSIKKMLIRFFDFSNIVITHVPKKSLVMKLHNNVVEYVCNIKVGDVMCPIKDGRSIIGRGYIVLKESELNEIEKTVESVLHMFEWRSING